MRAAPGVLIAAVLAACGSGAGTATTASTPAPTATTVAPSPTPGVTATLTPERTAKPRRRPTATPEPRKVRRRRPAPGAPPLGGAIPRYLQALSSGDIAGLCRQFDRVGTQPPACTGPASGRRRAGAIAQVGLRRPPRVSFRGRRATAHVSLVVLDGKGGRRVRAETLRLRLIDGVWIVSRPEQIFLTVTGS